jgi:polygalacturonase
MAATETTTFAFFDVKTFGAKGDGIHLDTVAIQSAIDAAAKTGGGKVIFPAGEYLSFSLQLKSNIELHLSAGATLVAADPDQHNGRYDLAEPNEWDMYQDFGHSHWHNSLIWGEHLENIAITGTGRIYGKGLTVNGPGPRRAPKAGDMPLSLKGSDPHGEKVAEGKAFGDDMIGKGNKAIALKLCRRVVLRDFSILMGGHFAVLATGVDQLSIDNLKIDTNRDALDIDCCRHVFITRCSVNSPNDDAICLKSSYALGKPLVTENINISQCQVSGFDLGTFLDGTYGRIQQQAPDKDGVTGRIKLGTESNGGYKNITITDCVFERCRGLAIESVDGAIIENVTISNIVMRELMNPPLFIRLGRRMRAPEGSAVGKIKNINISNIIATEVDARYASIIAGLPDHPIENVRLSNIHISHKGGGTLADAALDLPENETSYPEPSMFGTTNVHGLFARHVKNLDVHHVSVEYEAEEARPAIGLHNVVGAHFDAVRLPAQNNACVFTLNAVQDFGVSNSSGIEDVKRNSVEKERLCIHES